MGNKGRFKDTRSFELDGQLVKVTLEANETCLTSCTFATEEPAASASSVNDVLEAGFRELAEYFAGERHEFTVPMELQGTPFQQQVWDAARQIPFGQTRSYWWISVRMGNPHAARAVGGALGANPLPIFIPCHRVLRSNGALGGFSCGLEWKKRLLAHEAAPEAILTAA